MAKKKSSTTKKKTSKKTAKKTPRRMCGAMEVNYRLLEQFPSFRQAQISLEHKTKMSLRESLEARTTPYKINTVVHVVHHTSAQNISDAQIDSQIKVLNQDFRRTNSDWTKTPAPFKGLATDPLIEFNLDEVIRVETDQTSFGTDDEMKFVAPAKNPKKFLNLWVCELKGGTLGYAQFPGGPVPTDGVVITYTAFGTKGTASAPFNKGRTATHEVGHYLNLRHIWGDTPDCSGSDFVDDTPNAEGPNYGEPTFPSISCGNGPSGDMFMNYMDYVDDKAMFMFSAGQVARMHTTLDGPRKSLVT
ncbi:zinc metalloprotease [Bremerella volcania]|uniref:zinc metalloprotease n=1 Tax=Bremerella volcania TaxID=2527984 RepID=UPI0018C89064|nr:zinc metalloprotease [Bremerella volcania]